MEIVWEEPPEYANIIGSTGSGRYLEFAIKLREHPGRWAVLPGDTKRTEKGAMATAQNIRRGKVKGFLANQYDAAVHGTSIWIRYKADQPAEPPRPSTSASAPTSDSISPDAKVIRAWAVSQGMDVPERGRLPHRFIEAYEQAVARGEVDPDDPGVEDPRDGGIDGGPDAEPVSGSGDETEAAETN